MNTTVRNTLTVLMISGALVLGVMVAAPTAVPMAAVATAPSSAAIVEAEAARVAQDAMIVTLTAEAPVVAALATPFQDAATTPATAEQSRRKSGKSRRIRQSMAMPFFSFAPRG
ncbi:MAG: hypothetical protein ACYC42_02765 [Lysobacter sp.]